MEGTFYHDYKMSNIHLIVKDNLKMKQQQQILEKLVYLSGTQFLLLQNVMVSKIPTIHNVL